MKVKLPLTLASATAAFAAWEAGLRADPSRFMTKKEADALLVGDLAAQRAAYFMATLRATDTAVDTTTEDDEEGAKNED